MPNPSRAKQLARAKDAGKVDSLKKTTKPTVSKPATETVKILLSRTEDAEILECFSDAATLLTETQNAQLLKIFRKLGLESAVEEAEGLLLEPKEDVHCVRCHQAYTEHGNGKDACRITHENWNLDDWEMERRPNGKRWGGEWVWVCDVCDGEVSHNDPHPPDICFKGPHTTDVMEVQYGCTTETCAERHCSNTVESGTQA